LRSDGSCSIPNLPASPPSHVSLTFTPTRAKSALAGDPEGCDGCSAASESASSSKCDVLDPTNYQASLRKKHPLKQKRLEWGTRITYLGHPPCRSG
jgi:hypothetical protein